ncbi:FAD-dependent oxidoreductase [Streptomyces sp. NEAU-YJ-81]|uniref:FAD-dependent oxidoreductase n=1 Tax=Streptomyces sp. NEAU-YJ-81 TaxID=2820288 RepID=UPI001ABD3178|nr:FAD-dependent oxidoreductase [Streptomyces sp. NEAU-YJ-81]MBO3677382.1 FAD-dependent oxidoreductase [Streptomyces sp. NEAU-YJ-81]
MPRVSEPEVIICGAGAAGLTLAIDLARRNVGFLLIDKAAGPFMGSRGKGIQPRSQEVFEDLGVIDRIVASGGEYPVQRFYTDEGPVDRSAIELSGPTPTEPYQIPLLVPQFLTERCLRERLAELGHAPLYGHELTGVDQDDDGVSARIATPAGERTVRAAYLVGADGGSSFVRKSLDIGFPGRTLGVRAVVADVRADGVSTDAWHRWGQGTDAQVSLCPLYGTDMFQYQGPVPFDVDIDLSAAGLTALFHERTGRTDVVVREVSWASVFSMNARLADTYRRGRVFLTGDAAHVHPPTGGQGLNTGVQDAYNLGWKLAAVLDGAPGSLLASYEQERRPIAEAVLGLSERLLEAAKGRFTNRGREVSQLDLGYVDSPLTIAAPRRDKGPLAGERAPDAPLTGAGGLDTRLFSLFQGPHWTLLGYEADRAAAPTGRKGLHIHTTGPRGDLNDTGGHLRDAYGLRTGQWVLIRPDGYIAAIADTTNLHAIEGYLETVG